MRLNSLFPDAVFDRGCALADLNETERAIADFDRVLRMKPGHLQALIRRGQLIAPQAPEKAIADFTRVLNTDRSLHTAWLQRGLAYGSIGDYEHALADLNMACRLRADDAVAWQNRGEILLTIDRAEDAVSDLSTVVQLAPGSAAAHWRLGQAFSRLQRLDAAVANFDRALQLAPADPETLLDRARAELARHHLQEAVEDCTVVLRTSGNRSEARFIRAEALLQQER